jgi:hypothetical protein
MRIKFLPGGWPPKVPVENTISFYVTKEAGHDEFMTVKLTQ